ISEAEKSLRDLAAIPGLGASIEANPGTLGAGLGTLLPIYSEFENLIVIDPSGNVVARAVETGPATSLADRDWFQKPAATGQPYLGLPTMGRNTGRPLVPYGVPVYNDGRLVAVLGGTISLARLTDALAFANQKEETPVSLIDLRGSGVVLSHPDS